MLKSIFTVSSDLDMGWQDVLDGVAFGEIPRTIVVASRLRFRQADLDEWNKTGCPKTDELTDDEYMLLTDVLLVELKERDRIERIQYHESQTRKFRRA